MRFVAVLIVIFLFSCTKELDLKIPSLPQKVVVNALFCPDSIMKVYVSLSAGMDENIPKVENAVVKLYEDGIFKQLAVHQSDGLYNTFILPKAGKKYRIEVEVSGYEMVWAESTVPPNTLVSSFSCKLLEGTDPEDWGFHNSETKLTFQDDPGNLNYYELLFYTLNSNVKTYAEMVGARLDVTDLSIKTDGELDFNPQQYFFSDQLFNGIEKTILLNWFGGEYIDPVSGESVKQIFYADFKTVSPEYYNFRKSWTKHVFNQNTDLHYDDPIALLFLGDPVEMYSNVQGGYGVFAGFNKQSVQVIYIP